MVLLVEALQADTVLLCNAIHTLACLHDMRTLLEGLVGTALLLLQINDVAFRKNIVFVTLVVLGKFAGRDAQFATEGAEGIALTGIELEILVVDADDMLVDSCHCGALACMAVLSC